MYIVQRIQKQRMTQPSFGSGKTRKKNKPCNTFPLEFEFEFVIRFDFGNNAWLSPEETKVWGKGGPGHHGSID